MKRILLPVVIIMTMMLIACGRGKTAPSPSDAGGTTPTEAPTQAPTSMPTPIPTQTPTEAPSPTEEPVPALSGALSGFMATDRENVYINDKVTSSSVPRLLIKLNDCLVTIYEDGVDKDFGYTMQTYGMMAHTIADWNKVVEKPLQDVYTGVGSYGRRWLASDVRIGKNIFFMKDSFYPLYSFRIYDQDLEFIECYTPQGDYEFIVDDVNDRIILYDDTPYDQHIYECKYKTGETNKLADIESEGADFWWLYYLGVTDNDKLMCKGVKGWGDLDSDMWWNDKLYLADINTGELTELGFLDVTYEYYTETDPGIDVIPEPDGKRCIVKSSGYGTAYVYDWGQDKRVDIKLNDADTAALMNGSMTEALECVADWKHNALITYGVNYDGNMYCYSLETGELIASVYNRYASWAIPALDEENGFLYFYGMNGDDSEAPPALHVWDYMGINAVSKQRKAEEKDMGPEQEDMTPMAIPVVAVGDNFFPIYLEGNASAEEFFEKIKKNSIQIEMHDYGNFEKVGELPWSITRSDSEITTRPGDLILYQGNQITIYYDENTWNFTRLGRLDATEEEIKEVFGGKENIIVEFYAEWTE